MDTAEIRRRFLAHFEANTSVGAHQVVPSASLLLDDPNLLFVNAGMVPFKPYFLGQETPAFDRAVSVQKCVRTLDIEEVGKTTRHGTFFQMCGNFSFGDYFKEGAIELAWDLVTKPVADGGYGLPEDKLYPSVYEDDAEAVALWRKVTGIPDDRVVRLGRSENYWSMGVSGPGGPCSEILIDRGPEFGADRDWDAGDRYLEFWNLVFMQDELSAVRSKSDFDIVGPLPSRNIDTGMGLERVAYLLQGKDNMYEIDEIFPVIERASELSGRRYGRGGADGHEDDVRFRVVADHVRSGLMLISDGVTPGNEGRGYVLRRLLRRAVRSMRLLGFEDRALPELLPVSRDKMALSYPEVATDFDRISGIAYAEEDAFRQTLRTGTTIFDLAAADAKQQGQTVLTGDKAFALHDTYGFPIDLTLEMAEEQGLRVDTEGFRALMGQQRDRARADARAKRGQHADTGVYRESLDTFGPTDWVAYDALRTESRVLAVITGAGRTQELVEGEVGEVVLDRTPFYAESGGQNADAGAFVFDGGRVEVLDVQRPIRGLVVHQVRVLSGVLRTDTVLEATVDPEWRLGACQAHSGTHVVHAALREVLGPTALQSGSYNRPGYLRLDYGWSSALSPEQLHEVERVSNSALRQDLPVSAAYMTLAEAKEFGAIALFGETYDNTKVRVVEIGGPWSRELCGGTHVAHSSQIGTVVLTSESSVGSGNRRVEALVGIEGYDYLARERDLVGQLTALVKARPDDLVPRVADLVERLRTAEKELDRVRVQQVLAAAGSVAAGAKDVFGISYVGHRVDGAAAGDVRKLALDVRGRLPQDRPAAVAVVGTGGGKPAVVVAVNDAGRARGLSANALVRVAAGALGGSGGGKDDVAQGGGGTSATGEDVDRALVEVEHEVGRVATAS